MRGTTSASDDRTPKWVWPVVGGLVAVIVLLCFLRVRANGDALEADARRAEQDKQALQEARAARRAADELAVRQAATERKVAKVAERIEATTRPAVAEVRSPYADTITDVEESGGGSYTPSLPSGGSGGTVHVDGYYRKDGTYVRPHTRRPPKR